MVVPAYNPSLGRKIKNWKLALSRKTSSPKTKTIQNNNMVDKLAQWLLALTNTTLRNQIPSLEPMHHGMHSPPPTINKKNVKP